MTTDQLFEEGHFFSTTSDSPQDALSDSANVISFVSYALETLAFAGHHGDLSYEDMRGLAVVLGAVANGNRAVAERLMALRQTEIDAERAGREQRAHAARPDSMTLSADRVVRADRHPMSDRTAAASASAAAAPEQTLATVPFVSADHDPEAAPPERPAAAAPASEPVPAAYPRLSPGLGAREAAIAATAAAGYPVDEIAAAVNLKRPTVDRILRRLEGAGVVDPRGDDAVNRSRAATA